MKFETDPDLVYKTEGSEKIMRQEDVNISSFMAQVLIVYTQLISYFNPKNACFWILKGTVNAK